MYCMVLFRCRAPGLPLEHLECSVIFTEHGQKLCASPLQYIHCKHKRVVPWLQAAQGHTPTLHLDPPLKKGAFVESSLCEWLVAAVILHQGLISFCFDTGASSSGSFRILAEIFLQGLSVGTGKLPCLYISFLFPT